MSRRRRHRVDRDHPQSGACATKRRFRDRQQAIGAIHTIASRGVDNSAGKRPNRPYECPCCRGWHLTTQEDR